MDKDSWEFIFVVVQRNSVRYVDFCQSESYGPTSRPQVAKVAPARPELAAQEEFEIVRPSMFPEDVSVLLSGAVCVQSSGIGRRCVARRVPSSGTYRESILGLPVAALFHKMHPYLKPSRCTLSHQYFIIVHFIQMKERCTHI